MSRSYRALSRTCALLTGGFYEVEVRTLAPVPAGPVLVIANHPNSVTDGALVAAHLERELRFFTKAALLEKGPMRNVLRKAGAIPAYRRQDDTAPEAAAAGNLRAFEAVIEAWREGAAVAVFPEGVSHDDAQMRQLRTGAARMLLAAHEAGVSVQVVPVGMFYEDKERFRSRMVLTIAPARTLDLDNPQLPDDSRLRARAVTDLLDEALREVSVNALSREDLTLCTSLLAALEGRDHIDPLRLSRACSELASWRDRDPACARSFAHSITAIIERSGEAGVTAADLSLARDPRANLRANILSVCAGALVEVPVGLLGALGFAPAYWSANGVYRVVGRTGSGGSPVKIAAGAASYTLWSVLATHLLRKRLHLSTPAALGVVAVTGAAHLAGPPLLRNRGVTARSLLTQIRLSRSAKLREVTTTRLAEVEALAETLSS